LEETLSKLEKADAEIVLVEKQAPNALTEALKAAGYPVVYIDTLSAGVPQNAAKAYFERMIENARAIEAALRK